MRERRRAGLGPAVIALPQWRCFPPAGRPGRLAVPLGGLGPPWLVLAGFESARALLPVSGLRGYGCRGRAVVERVHADARHGDDRGVAFDWLEACADRAAAGEQQRVLRQFLQHGRLDGVLIDPLPRGSIAPLAAISLGR